METNHLVTCLPEVSCRRACGLPGCSWNPYLQPGLLPLTPAPNRILFSVLRNRHDSNDGRDGKAIVAITVITIMVRIARIAISIV